MNNCLKGLVPCLMPLVGLLTVVINVLICFLNHRWAQRQRVEQAKLGVKGTALKKFLGCYGVAYGILLQIYDKTKCFNINNQWAMKSICHLLTHQFNQAAGGATAFDTLEAYLTIGENGVETISRIDALFSKIDKLVVNNQVNVNVLRADISNVNICWNSVITEFAKQMDVDSKMLVNYVNACVFEM